MEPLPIRLTCYSHDVLESPSTEVRLIILLPGSAGPLKCHLIKSTLSAAPAYEAISYSWGDPTPMHDIWIDKQRFRTATSLFQCLSTLRQPNYSRLLWIDGICISQGSRKIDLDEKSQQILLMRQIFQKAECVLIYLGPQEDGSDTLPTFFDAIFQRFESAKRAGFRLNREANNADTFTLIGSELQGVGLPPEGDPVYLSFSMFLTRGWFRRAWVIQEAVLARKATMLCGGWQLPWLTWLSILEAYALFSTLR